MIPTIVRSLGYDLLPAASRAAELLTQRLNDLDDEHDQ